MGRLVRGGVQAGRAAERDIIAGGERLCAHGVGRFLGVSVAVRLHCLNVMTPEGLLDRAEMRQRAAGAAGAFCGGLLDVAGLAAGAGPTLHDPTRALDAEAIDERAPRLRVR